MKELNLNIDHWSMVNSSDSNEPIFNITDVITLADNISWANIDDLCDFNQHEYTH